MDNTDTRQHDGALSRVAAGINLKKNVHVYFSVVGCSRKHTDATGSCRYRAQSQHGHMPGSTWYNSENAGLTL